MKTRNLIPLLLFLLIVAFFAVFGGRMFKVIPPGHVGVAILFGKTAPRPFEAKLHFPVNPLYQWYVFDCRQKTHKEVASVPSQDQLQTTIEVSVQFRVDPEAVTRTYAQTGRTQDVIDTHLVPILRSVLREQGKTIRRAEDFFLETTQATLQANMTERLVESLQPRGIEVSEVLIRDIRLPPFIIKAIEAKKEREQEVEKQKAELERFRTEQEQKVAQAQAELEAAQAAAETVRVLAKARADEIKLITEAISTNPAYIQLEALKTLGAIAKDPAAKLYFINSDSPAPIPLMHLGNPERP